MSGENGGRNADFDPPFEVLEPARLATPLIFNSPHSGRVYPASFLAASRLDALTLRRSEDAFVDELFAPCVAIGAPLMRANFPRAYLDLNRAKGHRTSTGARQTSAFPEAHEPNADIA